MIRDYNVILRAVNGDEKALEAILRNYDPYITGLATQRTMSGSGEIRQSLDEDMKVLIQLRLIEAIPKWRAELAYESEVDKK